MNLHRMLQAAAAIALVAVLAAPATAQTKYALGSYQFSLPTGETKDWTDNDSWVGFGVEFGRFVKPQMSLGLSLNFNSLYERTLDPVVYGTTTITGDQYRNLNVYPLLVNVSYWPGNETQSLGPYLGVGVGAYAYRQLLDVGAYTLSQTVWHFGFAPEVGYNFPTQAYGGFARLFARYNVPLEAGDYLGNEKHSYKYFSVGIGLGKGATY